MCRFIIVMNIVRKNKQNRIFQVFEKWMYHLHLPKKALMKVLWKVMNNAFYFILRTLFVLKVFNFLSLLLFFLFDWVDWVNFKISDVTN